MTYLTSDERYAAAAESAPRPHPVNDRTGSEHDAEFQALLAHADRDGISRGELAVEALADELDVPEKEPGEADTFANGMAAGEEIADRHAARRIRFALGLQS